MTWRVLRQDLGEPRAPAPTGDVYAISGSAGRVSRRSSPPSPRVAIPCTGGTCPASAPRQEPECGASAAEQFADSLRFEAKDLPSHIGRPTTGQTARDFAASLATDPRRLAAGPTRSHGDVASTPVRAAVGRYAYSGLAVQRPGAEPQFAHLSVWDAAHPLAAV